MIRRVGDIAFAFLLVSAVMTSSSCGPSLSVPWSECRITVPDNGSQVAYLQKGMHYAMVRIPRGQGAEDHWLPWRPYPSPINVYYYPTNAIGDKPALRLHDHVNETVVDLTTAKTYLLARPSSGKLFIGEIQSEGDGSSCRSIDNGPWTVTIGNRPAEDISHSNMATNPGRYIGRIEFGDFQKQKGLNPLHIEFFSAETSQEQPIKKR